MPKFLIALLNNSDNQILHQLVVGEADRFHRNDAMFELILVQVERIPQFSAIKAPPSNIILILLIVYSRFLWDNISERSFFLVF